MNNEITIFIPYVYNSINADFIRCIISQLGWGTVDNVDFRSINDHREAFVHLINLPNDSEAIEALNGGMTIPVTYDSNGHYWKISKYNRRIPSPRKNIVKYNDRQIGVEMANAREKLESIAVQESIQRQKEYQFSLIQAEFEKEMEVILREQEHLNDVVKGTAEYQLSIDDREEMMKPYAEFLNSLNISEVRMTAQEKVNALKMFANLLVYL